MTMDEDIKEIKLNQEFDSYEEFLTAVNHHAKQTYSVFFKVKTTSSELANKRIVGTEFHYDTKKFPVNYIQMGCRHGGGYKARGQGIRRISTIKLGCKAMVTARVDRYKNKLIINSFSDEHNHERSYELYKNYPEVRRLSKSEVAKAEELINMDMKASKVASIIGEFTNKKVTRHDINNLIGRKKVKDANNLVDMLAMASKQGQVSVDMNESSSELVTLLIQSQDMCDLFCEMAEVLLINMRYISCFKIFLYTFVTETGYNQSEPVAYGFLKSSSTFETLIQYFIEANPACLLKTEVILINKDHKIDENILKHKFPDISLCYCRSQIINQYLKHEILPFNIKETTKTELREVITEAAYSKTQKEYEQCVQKVKKLAPKEFWNVFQSKWDSKKESWVEAFRKRQFTLEFNKIDKTEENIDTLVSSQLDFPDFIVKLVGITKPVLATDSENNHLQKIPEAETEVMTTQVHSTSSDPKTSEVSTLTQSTEGKEKCVTGGNSNIYGAYELRNSSNKQAPQTLLTLGTSLTRYEKFVEMRVLMISLTELCSDVDQQTFNSRLDFLKTLHDHWKRGHDVKHVKIVSMQENNKPKAAEKWEPAPTTVLPSVNNVSENQVQAKKLKRTFNPTSTTGANIPEMCDVKTEENPSKRKKSANGDHDYYRYHSSNGYTVVTNPMNGIPENGNNYIKQEQTGGISVANVLVENITKAENVSVMWVIDASYVINHAQDLVKSGKICDLITLVSKYSDYKQLTGCQAVIETGPATPVTTLYLEAWRLWEEHLANVLNVISTIKNISIEHALMKLLSAVVTASYVLQCPVERFVQTLDLKPPHLKPIEKQVDLDGLPEEFTVTECPLKKDDIMSLDDQNVPTDQVMFCYLSLLQQEFNERQLGEEDRLCMVMPRDMFIDWQEEKYGLCLLEQVKLSELGFVFTVLHDSENWALLVVNYSLNTITVINSRSAAFQIDDLAVLHWSDYVEERRLHVTNDNLPTLTRETQSVMESEDAKSSAIFVLMAVEALLNGVNPCIMRQCHVTMYRKYVQQRILHYIDTN